MEKLADIPSAGEVDVDAAVKAAKAAFNEWSRVPIKERARCLELLANRIEQNADALALLDAVDSGNAIAGMRGDMAWTADWLRYCAGLVTEIKGKETMTRSEELLGCAVFEQWADLPRDVQEVLFEAAVAHEPDVRERLATDLHNRHPRTAHPPRPTKVV